MSTDITALYEEIARLEREQQEVERRLKELEYKERREQNNFTRKGKRNRGLLEETEPKNDNKESKKDETAKNFTAGDAKNSRERSSDQLRNSRDSRRENIEDPEPLSKKPRTFQNSNVNRTKESEENKKLASAVVSGGEGSSERQSLTTPNEVVARNRKMFSVLLGTLSSFKETLQIQEQSEMARRRKEIEAKVQSKVQQERESIIEQQRKERQTEKARELARKEELERLINQKELALWKITWDQNNLQRSRFMKTHTSPAVYFSFAKYDEFSRELYKTYTGHEWIEPKSTETEETQTQIEKPTLTMDEKKETNGETSADNNKEEHKQETITEYQEIHPMEEDNNTRGDENVAEQPPHEPSEHVE